LLSRSLAPGAYLQCACCHRFLPAMGWRPSATGVYLELPHPLKPMSLVPRWRYMSDEAKALTRRAAVSAGVVLLVLLVFRALVPWVLLALVAWWIWKSVGK